MPDDKIKLGLDYGPAKAETIDVAAALDKLKVAADAVGGEFGELVGKSTEAAKSIKEIGEEAAKAEQKAKPSLGEIGSSISSLFTAFKAGDIKGIGEGISNLAAFVPALAPYAAGVAAVGAAAAVAWPILKQWYEYLKKSHDETAGATKDLDEYRKALEKTNVALKESDELAKAKAADEAAKAAPGKAQKERAETFAGLTKGREVATLEEVTEALDPGRLEREEKIEAIKADFAAKRDAMKAKAKTAGRSDIWIELEEAFLARKAKAEMAAIGTGEKEQKEAEELLAKAKTGDAGAIAKLQQVLPEGATTREIARLASPEEQDAARQAKRELEEERKMREEQKGFEKERPEIAEQRREADKAAQKRSDAEAARREGFETLPELGAPKPELKQPPSELPEFEIQRPESRPSFRGPVTPAPVLPAGMLGLFERVVQNQQEGASNDAVRIEQLQRGADQAGAQIQRNRSASTTGFQN